MLTLPPARVTAGAIKVKGGQTATSTLAALRAASAIPTSSFRADRLPFIFQLPATSLRRTCTCSFSTDERARALATACPPAKRHPLAAAGPPSYWDTFLEG